MKLPALTISNRLPRPRNLLPLLLPGASFCLLALALYFLLATRPITSVEQDSASTPATEHGQPHRAGADPALTQQQLRQVLALNLFGIAETGAAEQPVAAPETRLNLELRGLRTSGDGNGEAIIALSATDEQSFAVGDEVIDNTTLHRIDTDGVILQREGRFERLKYPELMISGTHEDYGTPTTLQSSAALLQGRSRPADITVTSPAHDALDD